MRAQHPRRRPGGRVLYFSVTDLDVSAKRIEELGGVLDMGPQGYPAGRFAVGADGKGPTSHGCSPTADSGPDQMPVTTCPVATIRAPIAAVWGILSQPSRYGTWADAELVAVEPSGPAVAGQVIQMRSRAAGRRWPVRFEILAVVAAEHRIAIDVRLPLGIVNHEVVTCRSISPTETWVTFN